MICFALLAHSNEEALRNQVKNIHRFVGEDHMIVIYNGGINKEFGQMVSKEFKNVEVCPLSKPLKSGKTGRFFYDVMTWLEQKNVDYEYLVYVENDVMFLNYGFEKLLNNLMNGYDSLTQNVRFYYKPSDCDDWYPGQTMWREWKNWKTFFKKPYFCGTFNPMQVYRRSILKQVLSEINKSKLEELFSNTETFALGEMLYLTLVLQCGGKTCTYPEVTARYYRFRPPISLEEIIIAKQNPDIIFVHPVKDNDVLQWIYNC